MAVPTGCHWVTHTQTIDNPTHTVPSNLSVLWWGLPVTCEDLPPPGSAPTQEHPAPEPSSTPRPRRRLSTNTRASSTASQAPFIHIAWIGTLPPGGVRNPYKLRCRPHGSSTSASENNFLSKISSRHFIHWTARSYNRGCVPRPGPPPPWWLWVLLGHEAKGSWLARPPARRSCRTTHCYAKFLRPPRRDLGLE